ELVEQALHVDKAGFALPCSIDLAIDAIKVADFVGIEIHSQGDTARAPAEDRIDESVRFERTLVSSMEWEGGHSATAAIEECGSGLEDCESASGRGILIVARTSSAIKCSGDR